MPRAVVIDMAIGNIPSLVSALSFLGIDHKVSDQADAVDEATHIILPGVGAYDAAMARLHDLSLVDSIRANVLVGRKPIIGICLGMQLLFSSSEEGQLPGLNLLEGRFVRLNASPAMGHKVPHVGFSEIHGYDPQGLFEGLGDRSFFYFTHSYALDRLQDGAVNTAYCQESRRFVAAFQHGEISGVQFHPEKSQSAGLRLLRNFFVGARATTGH